MKIVVFGAGAVGSVLGGILSEAHEVTLVGRAAHVAAVNQNGLRIEGTTVLVRRPRAVTQIAEAGPADLVIVTVKAFDTERALRDVAPAMRTRPILLMAQNGLGNYETARAAFPRSTVLGASVVLGANLEAPGRVRWYGASEVIVGGEPTDASAADRVVEALRAGGAEARRTDNLLGALWLKAIINAAINPLTALHRITNGRLLEDAALRTSMGTIVREAVEVTKRLRIQLPVDDPVAAVEAVVVKTAQNRSSMLQSVERGQRTEIDAITGQILAGARRANVTCPVNAALYEKIKALEGRVARS